MPGEPDHRVGQQLEGPAGTAGRRSRTGGGHQQRLLLAGQLALGTGPQLFTERRFQIAEHEAALGPVYGRAADPDRGGALLVAGPGIGRQPALGPLQLARRVLAPAQQPPQLLALALAQLHPVPYIHHRRLQS